jgi:hypothetical protein
VSKNGEVVAVIKRHGTFSQARQGNSGTISGVHRSLTKTAALGLNHVVARRNRGSHIHHPHPILKGHAATEPTTAADRLRVRFNA